MIWQITEIFKPIGNLLICDQLEMADGCVYEVLYKFFWMQAIKTLECCFVYYKDVILGF